MAGAGYKLFNTGDVLTAAQVNTYLQEQTVMVFASAAARTTALTGVVAEGMISYLTDTDVVQYYNGTTWTTINTDQTPLTTKGDLFTFSTQDARLAVGSNGETLVADSSATTGLRWQTVKTGNVLTNANFDIWQRGTSFTGLTAATYTADRWTCAIAATGENVTVTQDTSVPNSNSKYSIKYVQTANATSVTALHTRQFIEQTNVLKLLGKSCILSFWYRSNKTGSHGVRIYGAYNTGGTDQVTTFTVNAADTWEYKTVAVTAFSAVTAPSANPTDAGGIVDIGFRVEGAGFTTLSANDYFQVSQVQLEAGSVATAFQTATGTLAGELALAQRYFCKSYQQGTAPGTVTTTGAVSYCAANTANAEQFTRAYPVTMRGTPTVTIYSTNTGTAARLYNTTTAADVVSSGVQNNGESSFAGAGYNAAATGNLIFFHFTASAEL